MADNLEKIVELCDLRRYQNIAYGSKNGIFVNIQYNRMYANAFVHFFMDREQGIDISEMNIFLRVNHKKYRAKPAHINGKAVTIMLNSEIKRIKPEDVALFLDEFTAYLAEKGYHSACAVCHRETDDGYTYQGGFVLQMCTPCHEGLAAATSQIKREREETGSYLSGLGGAVLGGIVGIIPWVLIGMLGFIAGISGLAMAFFAYRGYLMLRGKRGPGMTWILILVLIVFTYVGVMVSQGVQYAVESGYSFDLFELFKLMMMAPFLPEFFDTGILWGSIGLGWFFAALGSFGFLRTKSKEAVGTDLDLKRVDDNRLQ